MEDCAGLGPRIRAAREFRGLSIKGVSETTGLTSSLISQFERGLTGISLNSLTRLASALNLPIASLFGSVNLQVIRHRERQQVLRPGGAVPLSLASPDTFPIRVLECRLAPGEKTSRAPGWHPGHECTVLIQGSVRVVVVDQEHDLLVGDSVTLDSHQPHLFINTGREEAVLMMVIDARS